MTHTHGIVEPYDVSASHIDLPCVPVYKPNARFRAGNLVLLLKTLCCTLIDRVAVEYTTQSPQSQSTVHQPDILIEDRQTGRQADRQIDISIWQCFQPTLS
jgi:hypothetical protein|eukprot:COSAG06_NODE_1557_length_9112_cov_2.163763_7_plen_101_part_00